MAELMQLKMQSSLQDLQQVNIKSSHFIKATMVQPMGHYQPVVTRVEMLTTARVYQISYM